MFYEKPHATTVQVRILNARDLPGTMVTSYDPYVIVKVGGETQKTTVKKGRNPNWDEVFTFQYRNEPDIRFTLFDESIFKDSYIGIHDLSTLPILKSKDRKLVTEIQLTKDKGKNTGILRIELDFFPKATAPKKTETAQQQQQAPIIINNQPQPQQPQVIYGQQPQVIYGQQPQMQQPQVIYGQQPQMQQPQVIYGQQPQMQQPQQQAVYGAPAPQVIYAQPQQQVPNYAPYGYPPQ